MQSTEPHSGPVGHHDLILSYIWIRRFVGIVGAATPALVILYFLWSGEPWKKSISDAYHTGAREVIVGGLSAIAVFLWAYRGHEDHTWLRSDKVVARIAAVSAFVAAHFPNAIVPGVSLTWTQMAFDAELVKNLHNLATVVFYLALAWFCLDNFCRHGAYGKPSETKMDRVFIYRVCGGLIIGTAIGIVLVHFTFEDQGTWIFWLECIGVWLFSVCWLIKGKTLSPVVNIVHRLRH